MAQADNGTGAGEFATLEELAADPGSCVMAEFRRAFTVPERAWRTRELMRTGDMQSAHGALGLADEAICAVLTSDDALLDHKLRGLAALCAGRPLVMELAACRIQRLIDTELFRLHVTTSTRRSRLAHQLCEAVAMHLPAGRGA